VSAQSGEGDLRSADGGQREIRRGLTNHLGCG
jgi:hypothetical protein